MTSDKGRETAVLSGASDGDVRAMCEVAASQPDVMRAMVTMANVMTRGDRDGAEVASLAVVLAPRMWLARRDQSAPVVSVMTGAVRLARRRVAEVKVARREWEETYGDDGAMVEAVDSGEVIPALAGQWCPRPDAGLSIGASDVLAAWQGMAPDQTSGEWLAALSGAWCEWASDGERVGRPLALSGAVAWQAGLKASDAGYRASRGASMSALESVAGLAREDVLRAMPDGERPGWSAPAGRTSASPASDPRRPRQSAPAEWEDVLRVTVVRDALGYPARLGYGPDVLGYGAALGYDPGATVVDAFRRLSDGERLRVSAPATGAPERLAAPERADFHESRTPSDGATVHLPSGKVPESPRKKSGTGAAGPMVPARR